ncbi:hypothetical protein Sjap_000741 [Stephania japonica]|uniref:X8 domain-containing protein n=1 Tax=Stephania japonica TaxID=461633 RepID=A0AAP0KIP3_9MAGN
MAISHTMSLIFLTLLLIGTASEATNDVKTWCVAKPSTDEYALYDNMNWACSQVDCSVLRQGCPCFYPDTVMNHASVAMNLYYQSRGRNKWNCDFKNSGLITVTDPSYGSCSYQ